MVAPLEGPETDETFLIELGPPVGHRIAAELAAIYGGPVRDTTPLEVAQSMLANVRARRAAPPSSLRVLSSALTTLARTAAQGRGKPWTGGRLPTEEQRDQLRQWTDWFYDVQLAPSETWSSIARALSAH